MIQKLLKIKLLKYFNLGYSIQVGVVLRLIFVTSQTAYVFKNLSDVDDVYFARFTKLGFTNYIKLCNFTYKIK